jgi:hypothetical protein
MNISTAKKFQSLPFPFLALSMLLGAGRIFKSFISLFPHVFTLSVFSYCALSESIRLSKKKSSHNKRNQPFCCCYDAPCPNIKTKLTTMSCLKFNLSLECLYNIYPIVSTQVNLNFFFFVLLSESWKRNTREQIFLFLYLLFCFLIFGFQIARASEEMIFPCLSWSWKREWLFSLRNQAKFCLE